MSEEGRAGQRKPKSVGSAYRAADRYLSLAYQISLSMIVYVGIGVALDLWLDTTPIFILVGSVVGFSAMMIVLLRFAKQNPHHPKKPDSPDGSAGVGNDHLSEDSELS